MLMNSKNCRDIVFDFTRSVEGFVSYSTIEELKDGVLYSNKYESGMKLIRIPHMFIFSNFSPDEERFSEDRLEIITL